MVPRTPSRRPAWRFMPLRPPTTIPTRRRRPCARISRAARMRQARRVRRTRRMQPVPKRAGDAGGAREAKGKARCPARPPSRAPSPFPRTINGRARCLKAAAPTSWVRRSSCWARGMRPCRSRPNTWPPMRGCCCSRAWRASMATGRCSARQRPLLSSGYATKSAQRPPRPSPTSRSRACAASSSPATTRAPSPASRARSASSMPTISWTPPR